MISILQRNRQIDITDITAVTTAGKQQPIKLMEALATTLKEIADQKKDIQDLRDEIKELREYIKTPVLKRLFKRGKK